MAAESDPSMAASEQFGDCNRHWWATLTVAVGVGRFCAAADQIGPVVGHWGHRIGYCNIGQRVEADTVAHPTAVHSQASGWETDGADHRKGRALVLLLPVHFQTPREPSCASRWRRNLAADNQEEIVGSAVLQ